MPTSQTSFVVVPKICPFRFHLYGQGAFVADSIPRFEVQASYGVKAQWRDNVTFQFGCIYDLELTGVNESTCYLCDENGTQLTKFTITKLSITDCNIPGKVDGYYRYQINANYPAAGTYDDGVYLVRLIAKISSSTYQIFYSEPICLKTTWEDTMVISYEHDENDFEYMFTDPVSAKMYFRIEGGIKSDGLTPGSKTTVFMDLDYEPVQLNSTPYNTYHYIFGGSLGVPNWVAERLNFALSCDRFYINSVQFTKAEGTKLERKGGDDYPFAAWEIDLLKSLNNYLDEFPQTSGSGKWDDTGTQDDTGTWKDV